MLAYDVHGAGKRIGSVEKTRRTLEHLHPLGVVHLIVGSFGLGSSIGEHQATGQRVESPHDEEVEDTLSCLHIDATDVL